MVQSDGEDLHNNGRAGRDMRRLAVVINFPRLETAVDDDPVDALDGDLGAAVTALLASPVEGLRSTPKPVLGKKRPAKVVGSLDRGMGTSRVVGDATVVEVGTEAKHVGQEDKGQGDEKKTNTAKSEERVEKDRNLPEVLSDFKKRRAGTGWFDQLAVW